MERDNVQNQNSPTQETTPPANQPSETLSSRNTTQIKSNSSLKLIIILIIAFLITAGFSGYLFSQNLKYQKKVTELEAKLQQSDAQAPPTPGSTSNDFLNAELANWKVYTNEEHLFKFNYPANTRLAVNEDVISEGAGTSIKLSLIIENINEFTDESPWTIKDETFKDKAALENGECFNCNSQGDPNEVRIMNLDGINAKTNISWGGLDECSLWIVKEILFYKGTYRIQLLISAPFNIVVEEYPNYFKDNEVCGYKTYKDDGVANLYNNIVLGKISGSLKNWWQTSDQILSTFQFTKRTDPSQLYRRGTF